MSLPTEATRVLGGAGIARIARVASLRGCAGIARIGGRTGIARVTRITGIGRRGLTLGAYRRGQTRRRHPSEADHGQDLRENLMHLVFLFVSRIGLPRSYPAMEGGPTVQNVGVEPPTVSASCLRRNSTYGKPARSRLARL